MKALKEAEQLEKLAIGRDQIIGLSLVKANALGMLGNDAKSCEIVSTIKERGAATPYAEQIANLVKNCP